MSPEATAAFTFLRAAIAVLAMCAVVEYLIWPTLVDEFRQELFRIRRELFLYMADGHVKPTDPAYVHLRTTLNGVIRMAERMTFLVFILHGAARAQAATDGWGRVETAIEQHPVLVQQRLNAFWYHLTKQVIFHIVRTSPLAWTVMIVATVSRLFSGLFGRIKRLAILFTRNVLVEAEEDQLQGKAPC